MVYHRNRAVQAHTNTGECTNIVNKEMREMKNKLFFISFALAFLLAISIWATALAVKPIPFSASGTISSISPGDVFPAGKSGRWVVADRKLTGTLSGDINGSFTATYRANVELETQAGTLYGTLEAGPYVLRVNGESRPLQMVPTSFGFELPMLTIYGSWIIIDGAQGQGNFDAWVVFISTPEGHVDYILDSHIYLTGEWQP